MRTRPWTTRLLARHAREHGQAAGRECLAAWCKAQCRGRSSAKRKSSNQAAQGYPSPRTALDLRPEPPACTRPSGAGRSRGPFAVRLVYGLAAAAQCPPC